MTLDRINWVRPVGQPVQRPVQPAAPGSFASILQAEQQRTLGREIKISAHAQARLQEAGKSLTDGEMTQIRSAIDKAASKGARESLVIMKDMALVVSVSNSTVITAVTGQRIRENVFTNIDSAVIVDGLDLVEGAQGALYQSSPTAQGGQNKL